MLHSEQVGFEKRVGQKRFLRAFPMYCHVLNFSNCLICASDILGFFQKLLDNWLSIFGSLVHFFILRKSKATCSR